MTKLELIAEAKKLVTMVQAVPTTTLTYYDLELLDQLQYSIEDWLLDAEESWGALRMDDNGE